MKAGFVVRIAFLAATLLVPSIGYADEPGGQVAQAFDFKINGTHVYMRYVCQDDPTSVGLYKGLIAAVGGGASDLYYLVWESGETKGGVQLPAVRTLGVNQSNGPYDTANMPGGSLLVGHVFHCSDSASIYIWPTTIKKYVAPTGGTILHWTDATQYSLPHP